MKYKDGMELKCQATNLRSFTKGEKYWIDGLNGAGTRAYTMDDNDNTHTMSEEFIDRNFWCHEIDYTTGRVNGTIEHVSSPPRADTLVTKDTNPKDAVGTKKWRIFSTISWTVLAEVGVAMLEGARKYGRHNYRVAGVRASVYVDASIGHIMQWWEGEDKDPDTELSHITKAIASLFVLRDAMIQDMLVDDRPPKAKLDKVRNDLQERVDEIFDRYPEAKEAFTESSNPSS